MSTTGMILKELEEKIEALEEIIKINEARFKLEKTKLKLDIANLELELEKKESYIKEVAKNEKNIIRCFNCIAGFKEIEKCKFCSNIDVTMEVRDGEWRKRENK